MEEHDNIMDKKNQIKRTNFERYSSIGTQECTYDYNDEHWDYI